MARSYSDELIATKTSLISIKQVNTPLFKGGLGGLGTVSLDVTVPTDENLESEQKKG